MNNALERYELVNKATHDAIWDWELATDRVTWNSGLQQLFGYDNNQSYFLYQNGGSAKCTHPIAKGYRPV
ncbi:hypothetical protein [Pedobacter sp. NJ-S-72]